MERIVEGILRHATDVYRPASGDAVNLGPIGSPSDYRIVVVEGDGQFSHTSGYGLLLVRGELEMSGTVSWNGLILVIGQGVMRASERTAAGISGAVFLTRTRADDRTPQSAGNAAGERGPVTFDLAGGLDRSRKRGEIERANQRFPYVPTRYREYFRDLSFFGRAGVRILEQILHAVLVDEEIRFRAARDADDVFVVVLDPAPDLFAVDQFDDDRGLVLGEPVDVFAFAVSNFRGRLPSFTAAGELIRCFHCLLSMGIFATSRQAGYC